LQDDGDNICTQDETPNKLARKTTKKSPERKPKKTKKGATP